MTSINRVLALVLASLLVTGCETMWQMDSSQVLDTEGEFTESKVGEVAPKEPVYRSEEEALQDAIRQKLEAEPEYSEPVDPGFAVRGTDEFINAIKPGMVEQVGAKGDITLNFENTDLREVVKVILGDSLKVNYIMDPGVRGGVTMQTGSPISRDALLPTLETLLRMNNATMVKSGNQYRVVPVAKAHKGMATPQLAGAMTPLPQGYSVQIMPLEFIGAQEMNKILEPLVLENSVIRVDRKRNLLILAGNRRELQHIRDVINTFDVDWIKGLSVGFFGLHNSQLEDVQQNLEIILADEEGEALGGLVRITPIESANGFLVVTPRAAYLDQVGEWIARLDGLAESGSGEQLFVYRVRNGKAEDLADLLSQLFDQKGSAKSSKTKGTVAPGLKAKETKSVADKNQPHDNKAVKKKATKVKASAALGALESDIRVVADEDHNTLLIMAIPRDYDRIKATLEKLDIVPLQVHIEATIVEVKLTDGLEYGIQWFFKGGIGDYNTGGGVGGGLLGDVPSNGVADLMGAAGFNWAMLDSTGMVRAALSAFADDSLVNVLSAPSVMVLDNHEASIQVGDEVPTLSQQQSTGDLGIISSVQYRDTGIILKVKPRVNPGGLVTMEISQEVSQVADESTLSNSPTISTRKIESTVAVQSGQTVVLGGLIRDTQSETQGGVPYLYNIPVVGALFGETEKSASRVELVIVLTPRVIANPEDARNITRDFRTKMQGLKDEFLEQAGVIRETRVENQAPEQ